jgi:membrane protein CcdC involved in cytochrome C biogenesis
MFFTTALMTLAVEAIVFKNYYSSKFGVVEAESYVFILNAFVPPIVWAINPYYIIARYKQKKKYGSEELTQE